MKWYVDPQQKGIIRFDDCPLSGILAGTKAQQIVTAVNSHDELLEALKKAVEILGQTPSDPEFEEMEYLKSAINKATNP